MAAVENGEEGELVERGSLRVDRARALEKLGRFQLGDPAFGVFFWVRCAVASGATRVALEPNVTAFTVSFDGRPLAKAVLADPYAALFAEDGPREAKHLAYGLLWARRLGRGRLTLTSGPPEERWRLTADGDAPESLARVEERRSETVLEVSGLWRSALRRPWAPSPELLGRTLGTAVQTFVGAKRFAQATGPDAGMRFRLSGGAWALMRPSRDPGARHSSAVVHVDGVAAGRFHFAVRAMPSDSVVEFPRAKLDASQSQAVRDEALDALLQELSTHERLLLGPALDSAPAPDSELAAAVRAACRLLLVDSETDAKDPLLARLWEAPLYRYRWGGPRSLRELAARTGLDGDLVGLGPEERAELEAFLRRVRRVP